MSENRQSRCVAIAAWAVRLCFAFVFAANVQCALGFALMPEAYMGAYELAGASGRVATQGIGVAFLMWNCTYPLVIWQPWRHRVPAGHDLLACSIDLFITFDAVGLVLMGASFAALLFAAKSCNKRR